MTFDKEEKASEKGVANKRKKWNKEKGRKVSLEGKGNAGILVKLNSVFVKVLLC